MAQDHTRRVNALQVSQSPKQLTDSSLNDSEIGYLSLAFAASQILGQALNISSSPLFWLHHDRLKEFDALLGMPFFRRTRTLLSQYGMKAIASALPSAPPTKRWRIEELGQLYERSLCRQSSKRAGIYYTPLPLVRMIVEESFSAYLRKAQAPTFCDPACGAGYFLLEALRLILRYPKTLKKALSAQHPTLCGVDLDEEAVEVTELSLRLELLGSKEELPDRLFRVCKGNSLLEPEDIQDKLYPTEFSPLSWWKTFPEVMEKGGFDCIAGNPPYGLARDEKLSAEENTLLKRKYASFRTGKVNKYLLFMAKSDSLLRESGTLSFIVPNAWLGIRAGRPLRELWIKNESLQKITYFTYKVFPGISVEPVVFLLGKARFHKTVEIRKMDEEQNTLSLNAVSTASLRAIPEQRIPLNWNASTGDILQNILKHSTPLGSDQVPFTPYIALQAYARGKGSPPQSASDVKEHVFHSSEKLGSDYYPYLQGGDIRPYHLCWSGNYLRHGPFLAEPQTLERFTGPRIAIREVLAPLPYLLSSCYLDETMLYNKSVLNIVAADHIDGKYVKALSCILNSLLGSYVIYMTGRKSQRRIFPKIVADDLKDFPVPLDIGHAVDELSALYDLCAHHNREARQAEIDTLVFELFKLSSETAKELRNSLSS